MAFWLDRAVGVVGRPLKADQGSTHWIAQRTFNAGDRPLSASPRQLGAAALVALVALRIGIGFHFFKEGADKLQHPKPFSAGFFGNAKGNLSGFYHGLVWDADGLARLDAEQAKADWAHFKARVAGHYGFDEAQNREADAALQRRLTQLKTHLDDNTTEITEYKLGLAQRDDYRSQDDRTQVASLRGQLEKFESELKGQRAKLVGPIDQMWSGFEAELNNLATAEQRGGGKLALGKPGRDFLDSDTIDKFIPYFDATLGLFLMIGLLTRLSAMLAALFLCSVIASQWPGSPGAIPVWPQLIEALGLFVIAATATGRVAGVDFFLSLLRGKCCPPKPGAPT